MKTVKETKHIDSVSSMQDQIGSDTLRLRGGVYIAKWSYFYSSSLPKEGCSEKIKQAFPNTYIINSGDHWHSFVGGAKTGGPQDTHFWVTFKLI